MEIRVWISGFRFSGGGAKIELGGGLERAEKSGEKRSAPASTRELEIELGGGLEEQRKKAEEREELSGEERAHQKQIELGGGLEGAAQAHDKGMLHRRQDVPLRAQIVPLVLLDYAVLRPIRLFLVFVFCFGFWFSLLI